MIQNRHVFWLFFLVLMAFSVMFLHSQETTDVQYGRRFQSGYQLYTLSQFQDAAIEFRRAQEIAVNNNDRARALYWVILSQMAFSDFGSAAIDIEELERIAPNSVYARDMLYHRARVYYIHGFFEEALFLFNRYIDSATGTDRVTEDRRAAAFFWMGESLFSMRQFDEAQRFYSLVISRYPQSPRVEAATYRLDLINHIKIEAELLALLQWSHEESLRTSEEFQRTIRTYEHLLNLYQRRITEHLNTQDIDIETQENQINWLLERAIELEREIQGILNEHDTGRN
jgi:TolA-binding protein